MLTDEHILGVLSVLNTLSTSAFPRLVWVLYSSRVESKLLDVCMGQTPGLRCELACPGLWLGQACAWVWVSFLSYLNFGDRIFRWTWNLPICWAVMFVVVCAAVTCLGIVFVWIRVFSMLHSFCHCFLLRRWSLAGCTHLGCSLCILSSSMFLKWYLGP